MPSVDINAVFNVINILLLCILVKRYLLKPIHKILEQRQMSIEHTLSDAEKAKEEALALAEQHRESMKGIEGEKMAVVAMAQKKASEEYDLIVADAKQHADALLEKAEAEAVGRKEEILRQARGEITEIIVSATKKISGVGGDSDLYDEFLMKAGKSDGESSK